MAHITPEKLFLIFGVLLGTERFLPLVQAQDYLSECDFSDLKPVCSSEKYLRCISRKCQCTDEVNHIYDFALDTCVIMTGRRCDDDIGTGIKLGSSYVVELDPRQVQSGPSKNNLPDSAAFPRCGTNALCDLISLTCKCKTGYFYNEVNGLCELSFGKSCVQESTIFNKTGNGTAVPVVPQLPYASSGNLLGCDSTLGLRCDTGGICKCEDDAVWKIDQGCENIPRGDNNSTKEIHNSNHTKTDNKVETGNGLNSEISSTSRTNYNGEDGQTPFQNLVNPENKDFVKSNNHYYDETGANGGGDDNIIFAPDPIQANSTIDGTRQNTIGNNYLISDRSHFPTNQQNGQNGPLWSLMLQQQQQQQQINSNTFSFNGTGGGGGADSDLNRIQDQMAQLQKLLQQQQQLKKLIDQLVGETNAVENFQQPIGTPTYNKFPPQGNYLGNAQSSQQFLPGQQQQFHGNNQQWNQPNQQQYQQPLKWPFPLFRLFRNVAEPFKQALFPNLADAVYSFPSPLHIAASTANNFLPVLRAIDQQFSPMLQRLVDITKPRPKPTYLQHPSNNIYGTNSYYRPQHGGNSFAGGNLQAQFQYQPQSQSYGPFGQPTGNNFGNAQLYDQGKGTQDLNSRVGRTYNYGRRKPTSSNILDPNSWGL